MNDPALQESLEEYLAQLKERQPELPVLSTEVQGLLSSFWHDYPHLRGVTGSLLSAFGLLVAAFRQGGRLFVCGNGGSFADALHLSAELMKSFRLPRPLPERHRQALRCLGAEELGESLQGGFPVIVLGLNHSLASALENDIPTPRIGFAQELYCLGRKGDVLLGISTSGKAVNVLHAVAVARILEMSTIALTGGDGGPLARQAQCVICVPATETRTAQEMHQAVYHTLCAMLEAEFFAPGHVGRLP
ncbi:MAG: SIS domain-containing protein [candidate division KSB1 bacterium]|nr:SIS domain-containing protein [candidate division KSB1 bacterium]